MGAELLEFGEQQADYRSLKAEITFPVLGPVSDDAPFKAVLFNENLTSCAFCHASEFQQETELGVRQFASVSLRPIVQNDVPRSLLENELKNCNFSSEPFRCALLDGLFSWGPVTDWDFPSGMATFP